MLNFKLLALLTTLVRAEDLLLGQCLCPNGHIGQLVGPADTRDGYTDGCDCYVLPVTWNEQTSTTETVNTEEVNSEETTTVEDVTDGVDANDGAETSSSPITEDEEGNVSANSDLNAVNEEGSTVAFPTIEDTTEITETSTTEGVDISTSQEANDITSDVENKDVTSDSVNNTSVNIETNDDNSNNDGSLNTELETTEVEILNNGSLVTVEETKNNETVIVEENNDEEAVEVTNVGEDTVAEDINPETEVEGTTPAEQNEDTTTATDATVVQTPPSSGEGTLDGGCTLPWNTTKVADGWIGKDEKDCNTCSCVKGSVSCSMLVCIGCILENEEKVDHGWKGKDGCKDCICLSGKLQCTDTACLEENEQTTEEEGEVEKTSAEEGNEENNVEKVEEEPTSVEDKEASSADEKDDALTTCDCGDGKTGTVLRMEEDLHDGKQDGCWCPEEKTCDCTGFAYKPICSTVGQNHFNLCAIQCANETPKCSGVCPCIVSPSHDIYQLPSPCDCGDGVKGFYSKPEGSTEETCICPTATEHNDEEVGENKGEGEDKGEGEEKKEDEVEEEGEKDLSTNDNEVKTDEGEEKPIDEVKEPSIGQIFGPCDCGDGVQGVVGGFDADTWDGKQDGCYCSKACSCPDGTEGTTGNPEEDTKDGDQDGCICPAHHCPVDEPLRYGSCDGILTCGYKEECCCGKCYNALIYECADGQWVSFFSEACHKPECTSVGVACECPGGVKGVRANVDQDTQDDHKNGCLCPKVVSVESTPPPSQESTTLSTMTTQSSSDGIFGSACDCPDGTKGTTGNFLDDTQDGNQDGCFCTQEHHIFGGPCHCPGGGKGHRGNYLTDTEDGHQDGCICTAVTDTSGNQTTENPLAFGSPCHCPGGTTGTRGNFVEDTKDGTQDGCFCSPTTTETNTASSSPEDKDSSTNDAHVCTCPDGIKGIKADNLMDNFDGTVDGCLCHDGRACHCLGGSTGIVKRDDLNVTSCFCVGSNGKVGVSLESVSGGGFGTITQLLLFTLAVAFVVVIGYYFYKKRQGLKYTQVAEETEMATSDYIPPTGGYSVVEQDMMQLR